MTILTEFYTDGNLLINNTGGLNFNILEGDKEWLLNYGMGVLALRKEGHAILTFSMTEEKLEELETFMLRHNIAHIANNKELV